MKYEQASEDLLLTAAHTYHAATFDRPLAYLLSLIVPDKGPLTEATAETSTFFEGKFLVEYR